MINRSLVTILLLGAVIAMNCSDGSAPESKAAINAAKGEVEKFVLDHLAAFEAGDFERRGVGMAGDIFMIAADPAEAIPGRTAILAEMRQDFDPAFEAGFKLAIKPAFSHGGVSKNLNTAWTAHLLTYTVMFGPDTLNFTLRNSQNAGTLVEQFRKDVKDFSQADLHSEVLVMGPEPQHPAIAEEAAKRFLVHWSRETGEWREHGDGLRAAISADGQVG